MTAVALVRRKQAAGHTVTEADLDQIRNICRCGTYARIREAIVAGEAGMHTEPEATHKEKPTDKKKPTHQKKPTQTKKPTHKVGTAGSP
jgi:hypothetical protein